MKQVMAAFYAGGFFLFVFLYALPEMASLFLYHAFKVGGLRASWKFLTDMSLVCRDFYRGWLDSESFEGMLAYLNKSVAEETDKAHKKRVQAWMESRK